MTKDELISQIARDSGFNKVNCKKILESFINVTINILGEGHRLPVFRLGVFEVVRRDARTGRNPRTGDTMTLPEHNAVKFRPSNSLKEKVNSGLVIPDRPGKVKRAHIAKTARKRSKGGAVHKSSKSSKEPKGPKGPKGPREPREPR